MVAFLTIGPNVIFTNSLISFSVFILLFNSLYNQNRLGILYLKYIYISIKNLNNKNLLINQNIFIYI